MIDLIKSEAIKNNIPIIEDDSLNFIINLIKEKNVKTILEIGTAVGYSAISFAVNGPIVHTLERNYDSYLKAVENINKMNLTNKIKPIYIDALEFETTLKYDLIFIDAAKAQYIKFFNKYAKNLNKHGLIISDNLNFHNLEINKVSRNTRQLINKLNKYIEFLKTNNDYTTTFYNIGDGISVSQKNEWIL